MKNAWFAVIALSLTQTTTLAPQSAADVRQVAIGNYTAGSDAIATYGRYFHRGLSDSLSRALRRDLSEVTWAETAPELSQSYVVVAFVANPLTETTPAIVHVLLPPAGPALGAPRPALRAPYRLPGEERIYEVFISLDPKAQYASSWVSTREAPPQNAQLIKLAEAAFSPLATVIEAWNNPFGIISRPTAPRLRHHVTVNRVILPDSRATVKVTSAVSGGIPLLAEAIRERTQAARAELERSSARLSPCAMTLNSLLNSFIGDSVAAAALLLTSEERRIALSRLSTIVRSQLETPSCQAEASTPNAEAQANAVAMVASRYLEVLSSPSERVLGTAEIRNIPSQRISFGFIGGAMLSRSGDDHFELDNNVIQNAPRTGPVTAAVVHIHPVAFDPTLTTASMAERLSFFAGVTTTPAAGFAGGITYRLFRGLGVQFSHTWLRADKLKRGFESGQSPEAGSRPFELGFSRSYSVGISYEFK